MKQRGFFLFHLYWFFTFCFWSPINDSLWFLFAFTISFTWIEQLSQLKTLLIEDNLSFSLWPRVEVDIIVTYGEESLQYFNSRPHVEVDFIQCHFQRLLDLFQFTTSHRGRLFSFFFFSSLSLFQFTTSHRGRRGLFFLRSILYKFQFTTSHRGRP